VIGRCAPELDRQLHAGPVAELVRVQSSAEAACDAGLQHRSALVDVECSHLAERVHPPGMRRDGVEHVGAHVVHVVVRTPLELRRHHVGAEEGGVLGEALGDVKTASLVGFGEAVPRLDLQGGDAGACGFGAAQRRESLQFGVGCGSGGIDRGSDAACLVRRTRHARGELVAPVAGEHEMRVAVDESGDDTAAARVDAPIGDGSGGFDRHDHPVGDHERHVAQGPERPLAERGCVRHQQPDAVHDERAPAAHLGVQFLHHPVIASARSQAPAMDELSDPATSIEVWRASRTTTAPPHTT
jgi:hypothetical protein